MRDPRVRYRILFALTVLTAAGGAVAALVGWWGPAIASGLAAVALHAGRAHAMMVLSFQTETRRNQRAASSLTDLRDALGDLRRLVDDIQARERDLHAEVGTFHADVAKTLARQNVVAERTEKRLLIRLRQLREAVENGERTTTGDLRRELIATESILRGVVLEALNAKSDPPTAD